MKETNGAIKVIGIILLIVLILFVGGPVLATAVGITLGIFSLAVGLIKLAIIVAVVYLVLVGIRAMLR